MDYIEFFTTNNKSGWKTREDRLAKNFPDIYLNLVTFIGDYDSLSELPFNCKIWHFMNNDPIIPKCMCGGLVNFSGKLKVGYYTYCKVNCRSNIEESKAKGIDTMIDKYGVDNYTKTDEYKVRVKKTNLDKYGVEYQISSDTTRDKIISTNISNYGVKYPIATKGIKTKIINTLQNRYGVDNPFQLEAVKNKIKNTNIDKYGKEYYTQTDEYVEAVKSSNLIKYGVDNVSKIPEIKEILRVKNLGRVITQESIEKMLETRFGVKYSDYLTFKGEYFKYKRRVLSVTNKQPISELDNYDRRGKSGVDGAYHLDHKFSILEGFKEDIDPEIIGSIHNLEFIPWKANITKGGNCSIHLNELLDYEN